MSPAIEAAMLQSEHRRHVLSRLRVMAERLSAGDFEGVESMVEETHTAIGAVVHPSARLDYHTIANHLLDTARAFVRAEERTRFARKVAQGRGT